MKRGQITIFVILGVVMILTTIIIILLISVTDKDTGKEDPKITIGDYYNEIQNCFLTASNEAILITGLQGGYFNLQEEYLKTDQLAISYAYIEGRRTLPSLESIGTEIENYINTAITLCNLETTRDFTFESLKNPRTSVEIKEDSILITLDYPIKISNNIDTVELNQIYNTKLNIINRTIF